MMRLFSSFDLFFFYVRNFILVFLFFFLTTLTFFKNSLILSFISIRKILEEFFYSLKPKRFNKISILISISTILFIFLFNFFSIFPYRFPYTSQFGLILSFALILWARFILFNFFNNIKGFISHSIPEGTPLFLTVFLFLIELIRNIIRPITLTVRLVANILAGHLLIILLSKLAIFNFIGFLSYLLLNIVEILVSLIQAYIFTTIVILYFSEIN